MRTGVAFIIGAFRYGGAERDLLELLRRLDQRRYDLHVLYVTGEGELLPKVQATGASLRPLGIRELASLGGMLAVRSARRYLRRSGVSIIQGFGVYGSFYAAVLAAGLPGVKVISYEFTPVPPRGLKARLFQPWYYRRSSVIVGNSDAVIQAVGARRGARGRRLVKIYNGVDAAVFAAAASGPPLAIDGVPHGVPIVGAIGRLHQIKGHDHLVAAWPRVLARYPAARLLLVGPAWPKDRQRVESAVRAARLTGSILLLGPRSDVARILQRIDVVALPSLTEGFSNVLLEAAAAGRPVVATRVGGNPEAVVEGETGLLVRPADPAALADAIIELLSDPDRRRRMGDTAKARVSRLYGVEAMVSAYDDLYRSLVEAGFPASG